MVNHTPAPWTLKGTFPHQYVMHDRDCIVRDFGGGSLEADAHLVAAAPELLAACERLMLLCDEEGHDGFCNLLLGEEECSCGATQALAAIAKAKGDPSAR